MFNVEFHSKHVQQDQQSFVNGLILPLVKREMENWSFNFKVERNWKRRKIGIKENGEKSFSQPWKLAHIHLSSLEKTHIFTPQMIFVIPFSAWHQLWSHDSSYFRHVTICLRILKRSILFHASDEWSDTEQRIEFNFHRNNNAWSDILKFIFDSTKHAIRSTYLNGN